MQRKVKCNKFNEKVIKIDCITQMSMHFHKLILQFSEQITQVEKYNNNETNT